MEGKSRGEFGMPTLGHVARGLTPSEGDLTQIDLGPGRVIQIPEPGIQISVGSMTITIEDDKADVDFSGEQGYTATLSPQARRVTTIILDALQKFWEKNQGYGDTGYVLGARGQYADMNRKMGKLKHTLWDGHEAIGESMEEMLSDLIGHAGLTIDYIREGQA